MNLKNILYLAAYASALIPIIAACDNISEDDRIISVPKPVPDPHAVPKTLLIQEFTGVRCTNCPDAAKVIHSLIESHPDRVVAVGMHPEGNDQTRPYQGQDFRTPEAQAMYVFYKRPDLPRAIFNGVSCGETYPTWTSVAETYLEEEARMTISLNSEFTESDRTATVKYEIVLTGDISDQINLMVWLTEDGIVGSQSSTTQTLRDYVHNHVLRKSFFSEEWGKELGTSFKNGEKITGEVSTTLDEGWDADNCHAVVFVQRNNNKVVEQTAEIAIVSTEKEK